MVLFHRAFYSARTVSKINCDKDNMMSFLSFLLSWLGKGQTRIRRNKYRLPLPQKCHVTLKDDLISDKAVFVIGDVHGCYDELVELMELARSEESNIIYIFVGDLCNKGPKSVEVIRLLRSMGTDAWSVRGNHDEGALREVRSMREDPNYNIPPRYSWIRDLSDADIKYLSELPYTISIPSHRTLVVHAGIVPGKPLEDQELNELTNMRNIIEPDDMFSCTLTSSNKTKRGKCWASYWSGPEHVYFGHDARRKFQEHPYATGLDTGCVYGGHLTGIFTNGKKLTISAKSCHKDPDKD